MSVRKDGFIRRVVFELPEYMPGIVAALNDERAQQRRQLHIDQKAHVGYAASNTRWSL